MRRVVLREPCLEGYTAKKLCFLLQDSDRKCSGNLICPDMSFHKEIPCFGYLSCCRVV